MNINELPFKQTTTIYHALTFERLKNECDRPFTRTNNAVTRKIKAMERKFQHRVESVRKEDVESYEVNLSPDDVMFLMDMLEQFKHDLLLIGEYSMKDIYYIDVIIATINVASLIHDEERDKKYANL